MAETCAYYAVKRGRKNGVFEGWEACRQQVENFRQALYKGFSTRKEALSYLGIPSNDDAHLAKWEMYQTTYYSEKKDILNVYVDGSYGGGDKTYAGAFLVVEDDEIVYEKSKKGTNGKAVKKMGSLAGELNAVMLALQYAVKVGRKHVLVYYDNYSICDLVRRKASPNKKYHQEYVEYVHQTIRKEGMTIDFIKVKAHNKGKNKWNERVDCLAVEARRMGKEVEHDWREIRVKMAVIDKQVSKLFLNQRPLYERVKEKVESLRHLNSKERRNVNRWFAMCQEPVEKKPVSEREERLEKTDAYQSEKETEWQTISGKCLHYLKQHKGWMTLKERKEANGLYRLHKEGSILEEQAHALIRIVKWVQRRIRLEASPPASHMWSYELVRTGMLPCEVAHVRGLKQTTVLMHLIKCFQEGEPVDLRAYLSDPDAQSLILEKVRRHAGHKISFLKSLLPTYVSYEDIKIVATVNGYPLKT